MEHPPKSWADVPLSQWEELQAIPADATPQQRTMSTVYALLGYSERDLRSVPAADYRSMIESLEFTQSPPPASFRRRLTVAGVDYGFVPDLDSLTLGEVIDLEEHYADWTQRGVGLERLMAVLYRRVSSEDPLTGAFEVRSYSPSESAQAALAFRDGMSVADAHGASLFFSLIGSACLASTPEPSSAR